MQDNTAIEKKARPMSLPRRVLMYATGVIGVALLLLYFSGRLNAWIVALAVKRPSEYATEAANLVATSGIGMVFALSAWAALPTVDPSKRISRAGKPLVRFCIILATIGLALAAWMMILYG